MAIPSLIIKRISGGDYLIDDLGIVVPNADQTEITDLHDVRDALCSAKLHAAAVAADLVLNDGARDIPVAEISCFMRRFDTGHVDDVSTYTDLPGTGIARQMYLVADEHSTFMWNGSGWTQVNVEQKRLNGIVVSKFGSSAPTEYKHLSGAAVSTYERFQSGKDNAGGAGYAGASREWIAGDGGDAGGGDYDGGAAGDLLVRPGAGGTKAGAGTDGAVGNFVVWDGVTQFFKVRRDGLTRIQRTDLKAASTDGLVLENPTPATVGETVQMGPRMRILGHAWDFDDSVSRSHAWIVENLPIASPTITSATLKIGHSLDGAAYTYPLTLSSGGQLDTSIGVFAALIVTPTIYSAADDTTLEIQPRNFTGTDSAIEAITGIMTQGDGETFVGLMVRPTYTHSGTASASDFVVSRKENSVGTGQQLLMDLGTCTTAGDYTTHTSVLYLSTTGVLSLTGGFYATGVYASTFGAPSPTTMTFQNRAFTAADSAVEMATGTWTHSTGEGVAVCIKPVWNSSGDASQTCLLIDSTSTTVGSGTYYLIEAMDDTSQKFFITSTGSIGLNGDVYLLNGGIITSSGDGDLTLQPNGTGIVIVDAAELKMKSGKKLSLGDGGAATDFGMYFNGVDAHADLQTGGFKNQHGGVTKWVWTVNELYALDGVYVSLGTGGYAADWYGKYTGTNCEMKIVSGEWQFHGGASEIYVINSSGQHGWFGAAPVAQHSSTGQTAGFTAGSGTPVNDDSTFTGGVGSTAYTIGDVVKALKNYGLMAA